MKIVNLKEFYKLYEDVRAAERDLSFWRKLIADGRMGREEDRDRAAAKLDEAKNALKACPTWGKVEAELDAVQSRARIRTVDVPAILDALFTITEKLDISKAAMDGVEVDVDLSAQHFPNAYKGTPESTQFTALYKAGAWRLTDIRRAPTRRESLRYEINHTEASRAAIIARFTTFTA